MLTCHNVQVIVAAALLAASVALIIHVAFGRVSIVY